MRLRSANDMLGNSYRPGDSYLLNSGIRYAAFGAKVTPMLQLNIARKQADTGLDIPTDVLTGAPVSGGTLVYLAPGASVRVGGGAQCMDSSSCLSIKMSVHCNSFPSTF